MRTSKCPSKLNSLSPLPCRQETFLKLLALFCRKLAASVSVDEIVFRREHLLKHIIVLEKLRLKRSRSVSELNPNKNSDRLVSASKTTPMRNARGIHQHMPPN